MTVVFNKKKKKKFLTPRVHLPQTKCLNYQADHRMNYRISTDKGEKKVLRGMMKDGSGLSEILIRFVSSVEHVHADTLIKYEIPKAIWSCWGVRAVEN